MGWTRAPGAGTRLTSWVHMASETCQGRSQKSAMNISVVEAIMRPDTEREGDSHPRQAGGLIPGKSFGKTQESCTWIPKVNSKKRVTASPDRRLETRNASATEESSKEREVRCSRSIHSRLRAQQARTQVRGPRKANQESRQVRKLDVTEALKCGRTLGRERCHMVKISVNRSHNIVCRQCTIPALCQPSQSAR